MDHAPLLLTVTCTGVSLGHLLEQAASLADHSALHDNTARSRLTTKPVHFADIDRRMFVNIVVNVDIDVDTHADVNGLASALADELHRCAVVSKCGQNTEHENDGLGRWERILQDKDDARVRRAIDWRSNFNMSVNATDRAPNDEDFKVHFERILNPPQLPHDDEIDTDVTIPILNDPISPTEVSEPAAQQGQRPRWSFLWYFLTVTCTLDIDCSYSF